MLRLLSTSSVMLNEIVGVLSGVTPAVRSARKKATLAAQDAVPRVLPQFVGRRTAGRFAPDSGRRLPGSRLPVGNQRRQRVLTRGTALHVRRDRGLVGRAEFLRGEQFELFARRAMFHGRILDE